MAYFGLAFCFIPLFLGIFYFIFRYKLRVTHILLALLLGLLAVFPISVIQYFLPAEKFLSTYPVLSALLKSIFLYGLIEEVLKTVFLLPVPHKNHTAQEFLLLSFVMGLSVACFESTVYYLDHLQMANARGAVLIYTQIFTRILTSDIIHMTCTGLCGIFLYSVRQKNASISSLVVAVLLHGIYDFFAGFQNNLRWFSIIVVLLAIVECRIKYKNLFQED